MFHHADLLTVNPSASVIELHIVGVSLSAVATDPSMEKTRRASFSSEHATLKRVSSKNPVPPASQTPAVASIMRETFDFLNRANLVSKFLPGPVEELRRERESVLCF